MSPENINAVSHDLDTNPDDDAPLIVDTMSLVSLIGLKSTKAPVHFLRSMQSLLFGTVFLRLSFTGLQWSF